MKLYKTNFSDNKIVESNYELDLNKDNYLERELLNIYPEIEYQTFYGFGGAITEASAYAYSMLSDKNKQKLVDLYYGEKGLNYNYARLSIDSCDFSLEIHCSLESENSEMSMKYEERYVLPFVKDVEKTKKLKYMLSPWSPPEFMKSNKQRDEGGKLLKEYYDMYAGHICKYIKEMQSRGLDIFALSIQNELNAVQRWDSCVYNAQEEGDFLINHLYPKMEQENLLNVKRLIWDHHRERLYERFRDNKNIANSTM